ncbi:hypothetical protein M422DRAFT_67539 [Sphaerobolus stellatus SS14]|uniref:Zinc finger PHD-type domain-containing protein n=1 Tax=Sphaerobolus stellatus (strain SS14) TaxID=990650 RepID=A0A0C9UML4_SPHS4|nr:hypothetical protein M422DRAFT_67539 [Sphaerobolus stellatus SS14]
MSRGPDTQLLKDLVEHEEMEDTEMLDVETQQVETQDVFMESPLSSPEPEPQPNIVHKSKRGRPNEPEDTLMDCDCGVTEDDDCGACQCEGTCGRWLHVWCMGFHSTQDKRLPAIFQCFACRLRNDPQIEILDSRNLTSEYISRFKYLSLFRRALKIVETHKPTNLTRFKQLLGTEAAVAGQTWKRLENEGFICKEIIETDGVALLETCNVNSKKSKSKQKSKKNIRRPKYISVTKAFKGQKYKDYFDPMKEGVILGLSKVKPSRHTKEPPVFKVPEVPRVKESQTQLESQVSPQPARKVTRSSSRTLDNTPKRKATEGDLVPISKRMKVSVGPGISLED